MQYFFAALTAVVDNSSESIHSSHASAASFFPHPNLQSNDQQRSKPPCFHLGQLLLICSVVLLINYREADLGQPRPAPCGTITRFGLPPLKSGDHWPVFVRSRVWAVRCSTPLCAAGCAILSDLTWESNRSRISATCKKGY